jgi:energy-converting hydrogenase Eha subunit C
MFRSFPIFVTWTAAFSAVGSLYVPNILGLSSSSSTPFMACVIAVSLALLALQDFPRFLIPPAPWPLRGLSVLCLALALAAFSASAVMGAFDRTYRLSDWGLFGLQTGTPVLIALSRRRLQLLSALGWVCVAFASADVVANVWFAIQGAWQRDPGLSGNTHAAGLVAFAGVVFLASREPSRWRMIIILMLIGSLCLIGARRYLGMAIVGALLMLKCSRMRLSLIAVSLVSAAIGLYGTFATGTLSFGDNLRASLMESGLNDALSHPLLGGGPMWRDATELEATYQSLAGSGVTESGVLDISIAFGMPAAVLFVLSTVLALSAGRSKLTFPSVMLSMLTAELAFGDSLNGFLGAILFFTSLAVCQRDEPRLLAVA